MKLKTKIEKVRESYFLDKNLVAELEKLSQKTKYTRTQLIGFAIESLLKENASI